MNKRKYIIVGLFFLLALLIIGSVYKVNKESKNISFQHKEIVEISREEYETKSELYLLNPTMHSQNRKFIMPSDNQLSYFKAVIKDKGYQEKKTIDIEVFFVIDEKNNLLDLNSFAIHAHLDKSNNGKRVYLDPIVLVEKYPPSKENEVYINVNVFLNQGYETVDYEYNENSIINYKTLKVIE
jgi:hypothetical protein